MRILCRRTMTQKELIAYCNRNYTRIDCARCRLSDKECRAFCRKYGDIPLYMDRRNDGRLYTEEEIEYDEKKGGE